MVRAIISLYLCTALIIALAACAGHARPPAVVSGGCPGQPVDLRPEGYRD